MINVEVPFVAKKVFKFALLFVAVLAGMALLLNVSVSIMEERESVIAIGLYLDGRAGVMSGVRVVIVVFIIMFYQQLIGGYSKYVKRLNHRQCFILKKLYPYVVGTLILVELLRFTV